MSYYDKPIMIHHDTDGVLRDFHGYAMKLFYNIYPEYKQYQISPDKIRGWQFEDEFWPLDKAKEVDKLMTDLFFGGDLTYEVFRYAPVLVTPEEWEIHYNELKEKLPNCRIVISTHQYTTLSKLATIEWLDESVITHDDLLFTGEKDYFGANFLLDDKPMMVERFSKNGGFGVLMKRERGNGWYIRDNKDNIGFTMVDTLEQFRKVIYMSLELHDYYENITTGKNVKTVI